MAPKRMSDVERSASLAKIERIRASKLVAPDPERDEAVEAAWGDILNGIDSHVTDKQYYPRYVAYAVGHTVAQMVSMVCFARLNRMNGWDHPIPGQHLEQWDEDEECQLPPIDSWARQCIPVELKPGTEAAVDDDDIGSKNRAKAFSKHRSSETVLASIQDALAQRRNSMQLQFRKRPRRRDSKPLNVQAEADKLFSAALAGWQQLPIEESSESEDETEAGSETSGDLGEQVVDGEALAADPA